MRVQLFHTQKRSSYFLSLHILNLLSSWHDSIQLSQLPKAESVPSNLEIRWSAKKVAGLCPTLCVRRTMAELC